MCLWNNSRLNFFIYSAKRQIRFCVVSTSLLYNLSHVYLIIFFSSLELSITLSFFFFFPVAFYLSIFIFIRISFSFYLFFFFSSRFSHFPHRHYSTPTMNVTKTCSAWFIRLDNSI